MDLRLFSISAAVASLFVAQAHAGVILSPVAATASSEFSAEFAIGNTIDQSGLSVGFVSGVDDFDAYLALNPTHSTLASGFEWFSASGVTTPTVTYDLGAVLQVARMALWNEEFSGFGSADISISVDGFTFNALTTINPTDSPLNADYPAQVFATAFTGRFVQLDLSGCPQPTSGGHNGCGIGEVAFDVVDEAAVIPVPAAGILLASGVVGLIGFGRRRQLHRGR